MHPILQRAHAWLRKGPLGVPELCDIVAEYKCWVADIPHGSSFLIIGKRNAGKKTLLRDLLQRINFGAQSISELKLVADWSDLFTIVRRRFRSPRGCVGAPGAN